MVPPTASHTYRGVRSWYRVLFSSLSRCTRLFNAIFMIAITLSSFASTLYWLDRSQTRLLHSGIFIRYIHWVYSLGIFIGYIHQIHQAHSCHSLTFLVLSAPLSAFQSARSAACTFSVPSDIQRDIQQCHWLTLWSASELVKLGQTDQTYRAKLIRAKPIRVKPSMGFIELVRDLFI